MPTLVSNSPTLIDLLSVSIAAPADHNTFIVRPIKPMGGLYENNSMFTTPSDIKNGGATYPQLTI